MYAIARIAGKQFRIEPASKIKVPLLPLEVGSTFEIKDILLTSDGEKIHVGNPLVEGTTAVARVEAHGRENKITVFRKKRRQGFRVHKGQRRPYTLLYVESIGGVTAEAQPKQPPAAETKPKAKPKKAEPRKKAQKKVTATAKKPARAEKPRKATARKKKGE
jgi:large subunit ribosomal protein L21